MHPIEGEFQKGKKQPIRFHIDKDNLEQNFPLGGGRNLRVHTYPAFIVAHVTIFDPSLRVSDLTSFSFSNGLTILRKEVSPGQELEVAQRGWTLTVRNNNPL